MRNGKSSASALDLPDPFGPRRIRRPSAKLNTWSSYSHTLRTPARWGRCRYGRRIGKVGLGTGIGTVSGQGRVHGQPVTFHEHQAEPLEQLLHLSTQLVRRLPVVGGELGSIPVDDVLPSLIGGAGID